MNKLSNIIFISLTEQMTAETENFKLDPSILLPIEIRDNDIEATLEDLSWEMIIAAILKIMAWETTHKDIPYFRELIMAIRPNIISELTQAAFIKTNQHDYDLAEEILSALTILSPNNPVCLLNLGLLHDDRSALYYENKNNKLFLEYKNKALKNYEILLAMDTPPLLAYYYSGLFFARLEDYSTATTLLKKFINNCSTKNSCDPSSDKELKKLKQKAQSILETIIRETDISAQFKKAMELIKEDMEEDGIEIIQHLLKKQADIWNGWFLMGWGYRRLGNFKKAKQAFEKALSLNPDQIDIYNELSICNMELNKLSESRRYLEAALKLKPFNIKILSNLAIQNLKENKPDKAIEFFRQVLDIDSKDVIANSWLKNLELTNEADNLD